MVHDFVTVLLAAGFTGYEIMQKVENTPYKEAVKICLNSLYFYDILERFTLKTDDIEPLLLWLPELTQPWTIDFEITANNSDDWENTGRLSKFRGSGAQDMFKDGELDSRFYENVHEVTQLDESIYIDISNLPQTKEDYERRLITKGQTTSIWNTPQRQLFYLARSYICAVSMHDQNLAISCFVDHEQMNVAAAAAKQKAYADMVDNKQLRKIALFKAKEELAKRKIVLLDNELADVKEFFMKCKLL